MYKGYKIILISLCFMRIYIPFYISINLQNGKEKDAGKTKQKKNVKYSLSAILNEICLK